MTHTPTADNQIYTCPACTFRAVQTTKGVVTLDAGDGRQLHLAAIERATLLRRVYLVHVVRRLRDHHEAGATFNGYALTLADVQRLTRQIIAEYA